MELQNQAKHADPPIDLLYSKLMQLKMDLLEDSEPNQSEEFQLVRT